MNGDLECGDLSPLWRRADLSASQTPRVVRRRQVACQKRRQVAALHILLSGLGWLAVAVSTGAAPLSPAQELASFRVADEALVVELVACEPDVLSPVAITWDADGRMFVAEMMDYPTGPGGGQIRMLEDRDGDGRYETAKVFADHLPFPNGVLPWRDGLLVTAAPNIVFLQDTDRDGQADQRRVILTGFAEGNQQLRVNGLLWGLDGWIYGANGRSDGEMHRPEESRILSLRGHDFRFQPETGEFEVVAGRSQFGLARDDWGNRFLSWNTMPVRHEAIPERYLARNPRLNVTAAVRDLLPADDKGEIFPLSAAPPTFNQESISHFNALAGLTVYRGDALPARYRGNAFVGETLRNLVHRRVLEPAGPSFVARRIERASEFLASTDPWFHPVNFGTGPDGALYIVDFYRAWVEHPGFVPAKLRDGVDWRTGSGHGRLWRVRAREARPVTPGTKLSQAPVAELVRQLESANGWRRDTSQRLLLERRETSVVPQVKRVALHSTQAEAKVQALHVLAGLGGLDDATLRSALKDGHPRVREAALRLAEGRPGLENRVTALTGDSDARVRLQAALSAGQGANESVRVSALAKLIARPDVDPLTFLAIRSSVGARPWAILERCWSQSSNPTEARLEFVRGLASDVGADGVPGHEPDGPALLAALVEPKFRPVNEKHLALLVGFAQGQGTQERRDRFRDWVVASNQTRFLHELTEVAHATATRPTAGPIAVEISCAALARAGSAKATAALVSLLVPPQPSSVQGTAASAISSGGGTELFRQTFMAWERCSIPTRRRLLSGLAHTTVGTSAVIEALREGRLVATELDAAVRQNLLQHVSPDTKAVLPQLLSAEFAERGVALEKYSPALQLAGEPRRGAVSFARLCLQCHAWQGHGQRVGPDLSSISTRGPEALLADIIDPSRQVASDFVSYSVTTTEGETVAGLIVSETPAGVTVRRANAPDETIPRAQIRGLQASGRSLMPDGLEAGLTVPDLADLLAFLRQPDPAFFPNIR